MELLIDALTDDVSLVWVLTDIGIRGNPPAPPGRPSLADIDAAFDILARLTGKGLLTVGRME